MITSAAMRAGFSGGLVVDFPNSAKAKKYYLVLMVGQSAEVVEAQPLTGEEGRPANGVSVVRCHLAVVLSRVHPRSITDPLAGTSYSYAKLHVHVVCC